MSATTDRAQFYIEQLVPELRELEAKKIFDEQEIRQIVRQRRNYEHKMNAPGCRPQDCMRYLAYETNLNEMRMLRAKRVGSKVAKHSGARRLFPLLERMLKKFPGDLDLWTQYINYAKKQKAYKRVRKAYADMLRLHPEKADLWVYAARYEFEEQGDITEAESYIQRGLRMSPHSKKLYYQFFRLMLDSLAKMEVKSRKIGRKKILVRADVLAGDGKSDADQITLPSTEEDDFDGDEEVDPNLVEALEKARGPHEEITRAIFDSAMKQFRDQGGLAFASDLFELAACYEIPSRASLLTHIYEYMRDRDINNAVSRNAALRMPLVGLVVNTSRFALSLAAVLGELNKYLAEESVSARRLHVLSARWLHQYLQVKDIDEGIAAALRGTLNQIIASYYRFVRSEKSPAWESSLVNPHEEAVELLNFGQSIGGGSQVMFLREAAIERWPGRITSLDSVKAS